MTDLASSDITVTVLERGTPSGKKRRNRVQISFGNGTLTYPSGGVPLPTYASFGMGRNLDFISLTDQNDASGILWKYDQSNNKLRGYEFDYTAAAEGSAIELDAGVDAPAAQTMFAEAVGW